MTLQHPKIESRGSVRRPDPVRSNLFRIAAIAAAVPLVIGCNGDGETENPKSRTPAENGAGAADPPSGSGEASPAAAVAAVPATARPGEPGSDERAAAFAAEAVKRITVDRPSVRGDDPAWFFLTSELRQLGHGKFWETGWSGTDSGGTKLDAGIDPLPSMAEFHGMLEAKGVELIILPIPAKGSIYPDKLAAGFEPGDVTPLTPYLDKMKEKGLNVIDLEPLMLRHRAENPDEKLWCEQDAHYTPRACEIIAELVKKEIEERDWFAGLEKTKIVRTDAKEQEITGDQIVGSEWEGEVARERLTFRFAGRGPEGGGQIEPVEPDPDSPILLMGDSHTLVFQEGASGGMHAKGAGLLDQLAFALQVVPDHLGIRGSGLMQARRQLLMSKVAANPDYWDDKSLVIWVFSVREFTQSIDRIISIPIER